LAAPLPLSCESEPIRIPGSIQPHGFLLAIDLATQRVLRASGNAGERLGRALDTVLGKLWSDSLEVDSAQLETLIAQQHRAHEQTAYQPMIVAGRPYNVVTHISGGELIAEFEDSDSAQERSLDALYPQIREGVERLQAEQPVEALCALAAELVREMTGFDRALIYRFDTDGNGTVVGEARNDKLPPYLDLRFPSSDIPAQARELYRLNRIRLIPDVSYAPIPIVDAPGSSVEPLDMTLAVLRSVSPIHLEYMRNMGRPASMSISIVQEGRLWGLISCHHTSPRRVPTQVRAACDFLAQIISMQLAGKHRAADAAERVERQETQSELLALMAQEKHFVHGLVRRPDTLMALADATGAAVLLGDECLTVGTTPDEAAIRGVVDWLSTERANEEVFATDCLSAHWPDALPLSAAASGLLAVSISQIHRSYVLWFRAELVQTVKWGGDPRKPVGPDGDRLHPRKSFEIWKETVRLRSAPWSPAQVAAATSLRNAVIGIVMRQAEELADLTGELKRSNKELEAFSYSVSHDLRAPFRHIVGYAELLKEEASVRGTPRALRYVDTIIESAHTAGKLVDGLLGFSQAGRVSLMRRSVDVDQIVRECLQMLGPDLKGRSIDWDIAPLGHAVGDPSMLRQVFQNLLSNAIKYTREREVAHIEVTRESADGEIVFVVRDNGVGFDMRYVTKLFGVFQRLHRMEEFEGTGIGLANVRRIAERHGGRTWAEGEVGQGAAFYFALPIRGEPINE